VLAQGKQDGSRAEGAAATAAETASVQLQLPLQNSVAARMLGFTASQLPR